MLINIMARGRPDGEASSHHYHHRAFYLGVLGVVFAGAGLLALNFPVFIDAFDRFGFQINAERDSART